MRRALHSVFHVFNQLFLVLAIFATGEGAFPKVEHGKCGIIQVTTTVVVHHFGAKCVNFSSSV